MSARDSAVWVQVSIFSPLPIDRLIPQCTVSSEHALHSIPNMHTEYITGNDLYCKSCRMTEFIVWIWAVCSTYPMLYYWWLFQRHQVDAGSRKGCEGVVRSGLAFRMSTTNTKVLIVYQQRIAFELRCALYVPNSDPAYQTKEVGNFRPHAMCVRRNHLASSSREQYYCRFWRVTAKRAPLNIQQWFALSTILIHLKTSDGQWNTTCRILSEDFHVPFIRLFLSLRTYVWVCVNILDGRYRHSILH